MKALVRHFAAHRLLAHVLVLAVVGLGAITLGRVPRAIVPTRPPEAFLVEAVLPDAPAVDVERFVTFRIEETLFGLEGVRRITSRSEAARASVRLELSPGAELRDVMDEAQNRLAGLRPRLPADLEPIQVRREDRTSNVFLMDIHVQNVDPRNRSHRHAVLHLRERLRRIPGVEAVNVSLPALELRVALRPEALGRLGVSAEEVRARVHEFLRPWSLGRVDAGPHEVAVALADPFHDLDALRALPVRRNRRGQGPSLADVADVSYGLKSTRVAEDANGAPDVALLVINDLRADAVRVSERVHQLLAQPDLLPEPMRFFVGRDVSELIDHEIDTLLANAVGGFALVLFFMWLFLSGRVALVTALGLPVCYLGLIALMPVFGLNFNVMTLVAMILVVGILVDDAIMVSDSYVHERGRGLEPVDAAVRGVMTVAKPVLGMAATTIAAFLPVLLLDGYLLWLFQPVAIVVIAAILLSVLDSFFLLPHHLRSFVPRALRRRDPAPVRWATALYAWSLLHSLRFRYLMVLAGFGLLGLGGYLLAGPVGFDSDLNLNAAAELFVELSEPAESLDALRAKLQPVDKILAEAPEGSLEFYTTTLGVTWRGRRSLRYARITAVPPGNYVEKELRRHRLEAFLRPRLKALEEGGDFRRLRTLKDMRGRSDERMTIFVSGSDRVPFAEVQQAIQAATTELSGVVDVTLADTDLAPLALFEVDAAKALSYGLSRAEVHAQLRQQISSNELIRIRQRGEEVDVRLSLAGRQRISPADNDGLSVIAPSGYRIPLDELGRWKEMAVLRTIPHRDLLRLFEMNVVYDREAYSADDIKARIEAGLQPVRDQYRGFHISVRPDEGYQEAKSWAFYATLAAAALVYLCLVVTLGSWLQPLLVMLAVPFGLVGVVLAFYAHGLPVSIIAVIGILGLIGVVVNDALVLVNTVNGLEQAEGLAPRAAIEEGARRRFRPILLTSLTTLAGVFPLAYGWAGEAGWIRPMVLAVGWGLLFATFVTLVLLPAFLAVLADLRLLSARLRGRMGTLFRRRSVPRDDSGVHPRPGAVGT